MVYIVFREPVGIYSAMLLFLQATSFNGHSAAAGPLGYSNNINSPEWQYHFYNRATPSFYLFKKIYTFFIGDNDIR